MEGIEELVPLAAAAIGALVLVLVVLRVMRRAKGSADRQIDGALQKGDYKAAALLAEQHGKTDAAIDYHLRGQNILAAATTAETAGAFGRAAELFERIDKLSRAAELYEKAGMHAKAAALRPAAADDALVSAESVAPADEETSSDPPADPESAPSGDPSRAEEFLRNGQVEEAAAAFREAGLLEEAVHLYVNVLGKPGEAAPLVEALGNPTRAAELRAQAKGQPSAPAAEQPDDDDETDDPFQLGALAAPPPLNAPRATESADRQPRRTAVRGSGSDAPAVDQATLSAVARVAAEAALQFQSNQAANPTLAATMHVSAPTEIKVKVAGLEETPLELVLVNDEMVQRARKGPTVEALWEMIGDQPCVLQNIEVYYRLALAYLSDGRWSDAAQALDAVEEASPGYRDAHARLDELKQWQGAHEERLSMHGASKAESAGEAGRYEVRGELGRGGMAAVYRATDSILAREIALKFMAPEYGEREEMRELFQREARSAAQLTHANIVATYDFGTLEGRLFIAMEYVQGHSVERLLEDHGPLPLDEAVQVTLGVLAGLEYAHGRKIIHRDIKPSNVIRTPTGEVKLMDFGLAKSVEDGVKASVIAGTPAYMPPEQFALGDVDHRADIFATGVSLYEMLSGQLPFAGYDREEPPTPLSELVPGAPAGLDAIMARALAKDPNGRFESAAAFAAAIRPLLDEPHAKATASPTHATLHGIAPQTESTSTSRSTRAWVPPDLPER